MSAHLWLLPNKDDTELKQLLDTYDVSLETYQLGQLLTRCHLIVKVGDLGNWAISGLGPEPEYLKQSPKMKSWKEKLELAHSLISKEPSTSTYGHSLVRLYKGLLFDQAVDAFSSFLDMNEKSLLLESGGHKFTSKIRTYRERKIFEDRIDSFMHFETKKFVRSPMVMFDEENQSFIFFPERHPYFREWLLYNYAFWAPLFKSRIAIGKHKVRSIETVRSHELVPFLAKKFEIEHKDCSMNGNETQNKIILNYYEEKTISALLDNSFFRRDRLASVYSQGIIDREIMAFVIQSLKPFSEYRGETLMPICLQTADKLMTVKPPSKKKAS